MKKLNAVLLIVFIAFSASSQDQPEKRSTGKRIVPTAISVSADQASAKYIKDIPLYSSQILSELNQSQQVFFVIVDLDTDPEVIIELTVDNLAVRPRTEKSNSKNITTSQIIGTNAQGRPIARPASLVQEDTYAERSASATFNTKMSIITDPLFNFEKKFHAIYNYSETSTSFGGTRQSSRQNIGSKPNQEPKTDDFLIILTKKELTGRLSSELRKHYSNNFKTSKLQLP